MGRVFLKGTVAIAEAAVRAGCRFYAGYPITPQNELPEYMSGRLPEVGGHFVQGESEIASISMVFGAAASGTRSMISSSSSGMSLMSEMLSHMAGSDVPGVIVSCQRGGPGLGVIQPSQGDYFQAVKAHGNGGFRMYVLAPHTTQEAVDLTYEAFDIAEKFRKPVMILTDGVQATLMETVELPPMKSEEEVLAAKEACRPWAVLGRQGGARHKVDSTWRPDHEGHNKKDAELYESWKKNDVRVEEYLTDDAEFIITGYGISARIAKTAIKELRAEGLKVGLIRPITVFPFPVESYRKLDPQKVKGVLSVEHSYPAQFAEDVDYSLRDRIPMDTLLHSGGIIVQSEEIIAKVKEMMGKA